MGALPWGWRRRRSTTACLMRYDPESNSLTSLASAYRNSPFVPRACPLHLSLCWPSVRWCNVTPTTPPRWDVFLSQSWILSFASITPTLQPRCRFLKPRWHICPSESSDFQSHHHFCLAKSGLAFFSFRNVQVSFCCYPNVWLSAGQVRDMSGVTNASFLAEVTNKKKNADKKLYNAKNLRVMKQKCQFRADLPKALRHTLLAVHEAIHFVLHLIYFFCWEKWKIIWISIILESL